MARPVSRTNRAALSLTNRATSHVQQAGSRHSGHPGLFQASRERHIFLGGSQQPRAGQGIALLVIAQPGRRLGVMMDATSATSGCHLDA